MSLARAIRTGDLAQLPSRRDEDWRWSDLRALIRVLPPASPAHCGAPGPGPFAGLEDEEVCLVNGRGPARIDVPQGTRRTIALRLIAAADAGAHAARLAIDIGANASLVLLESYEGEGADYAVETDLSIDLARGARLERIVLTGDAETGVSVSRADIRLGAASTL